MNFGPKSRGLFVCGFLALCFTAFSARLIQLQVIDHEKYAAIAGRNHGSKQTIFAPRGVIEDINGEVLADNEPLRRVVADGSLITKPAELAALLAKPLGMGIAELEQKLTTKMQYVPFKARIPEADAAELAAQMQRQSLKGIFFEPDARRIYPNRQMLAHVIGFMDRDHGGVQGIERSMENFLRGHDGYRVIERDRTGKELVAFRGMERAPQSGNNVRLTIDMSLQQIVEEELESACRQFKPKMAVGIMMRPKTGEILAIANRPTFDPNKPAESADEAMKNHAIIDMIEPGSTFKIVTAAAALNEKIVHPDTMIFCDWGHFQYGGRTLHDHHNYGDLSVEDILVKSSNIGAAHLGLKLGDQKLYEYVRRFGFGERTGIGLPGEIPGMVHPPHQWTKISITHIPMGHEVGVTPLQSVAAMCAIANGGHLMIPQIVHEVTDPDGAVVESFPPVEIRQAVSEKVAGEVRKALVGVVSTKGTAALAKVTGYTVFGKTGTAQKVDPKGGYMPGKYIVSFIGGLPAEDPQFVCMVLLDDAQTKAELNYGGQVAAPVFSRIAEKAARYLGIPAHEEAPGRLIITQSQSQEGTRD
jgi:cell division protein FtsI (penicillin-binding protein 3)/stage V sporulation protein D (sporulation-specific penicillin-binding protein)